MKVSVTAAYEIAELKPEDGVRQLREIFPDGKANDLNFVLFSTAGTHGSYLTIEEVLASLDGDEPELLTVLVIQPRVVRMLYGSIEITKDDRSFLRLLRESSFDAMVAGYGPPYA